MSIIELITVGNWFQDVSQNVSRIDSPTAFYISKIIYGYYYSSLEKSFENINLGRICSVSRKTVTTDLNPKRFPIWCIGWCENTRNFQKINVRLLVDEFFRYQTELSEVTYSILAHFSSIQKTRNVLEPNLTLTKWSKN